MKNPRKTIIYLFLIFHLLHFIGALYIESRQDDLGFLLSIKGYLPLMKYFALSGLILFLIAYIVLLRETRFLRKEVTLAKEEHTELKAKLFDLQEEVRKSGLRDDEKQIEVKTGPPLEEGTAKEEEQEEGKEDNPGS
jgi:hypothetical protein